MKKIVSLVLIITLSALALCSCGEQLGTGASEYATSRDVTGRHVHYVEMCVSGYGKVIILLDASTAPKTVHNFLDLVNEGFYDGLTFHRVLSNFMIQGGDPKADGTGGHTDENGKEINVTGEFLLNGYWNDISHIRGVISMARSNDYNSASSQFFICNADSTQLDYQYAAFGYVIQGMSVIDEITAVTSQYAIEGVIRNKAQQAKISYIRELENYSPEK